MAMRVVPLLRRRSPSPATLRRLRSSLSGNDHLIEIDLSSPSSSSSSADESSSLKRLDDVVQRLMVQKATPDWIPFLPGASFWVPPRTRRRNLADLLSGLAENLPDDLAAEHDRPVSILFSGGRASEQESGAEDSSSSSYDEELAEIAMESTDEEGSSDPSEDGQG